MEPIFTLPYSEFRVANLLADYFKSSDGYSVFVPASRQEKGVDLLLARYGSKIWRSVSFQIKASRVYLGQPPKLQSTRTFRYFTWFNRFDVSDRADFVLLFSLFQQEHEGSHNIMASKWMPVVMAFTNREMKRFVDSVKTRKGKPDRMFGFGFDSPLQVIQTRGDQKRSAKEYTSHLLENRLAIIREALEARG